jgi:acyl-CoA thioesterase-1
MVVPVMYYLDRSVAEHTEWTGMSIATEKYGVASGTMMARCLDLCVLMLAACLFCSASVGSASAASLPLILVVGDSVTAGYGLPPEQSFPAVLQTMLLQRGHVVEVVNAGVSGDTTAEGLARLPKLFPPYSRRRPDLLILQLGANDGIQGRDLAQVEANLDAMLALAREHGAQVLLAGSHGGSRRSEEYRLAFTDIYQRLARKHDAVLYPILGVGILGNPEYLQQDGAHPNEAGARLIARNLYPLVVELLVRTRQY